MRFAVLLMRHRGRPVGVDLLRAAAPIVGDVRIEEIRDETHMRYVRTARVLDFDRPRAVRVLAELHEPVVVAMTTRAFTIAGVERIGEQAFAQSWLLRRAP
jgi:hypothetical protein